MAIDDDSAAGAGFSGAVIPGDVEDIVRGGERAVGVLAEAHNAGFGNAERFDVEIARVIGRDIIFGALFFGHLFFGDFFFDGGRCGDGARRALFAGIVGDFPDADFGEENDKNETQNRPENLFFSKDFFTDMKLTRHDF